MEAVADAPHHPHELEDIIQDRRLATAVGCLVPTTTSFSSHVALSTAAAARVRETIRRETRNRQVARVVYGGRPPQATVSRYHAYSLRSN